MLKSFVNGIQGDSYSGDNGEGGESDEGINAAVSSANFIFLL